MKLNDPGTLCNKRLYEMYMHRGSTVVAIGGIEIVIFGNLRSSQIACVFSTVPGEITGYLFFMYKMSRFHIL